MTLAPSSPYFHKKTSVRRVMLTVAAALIPAILVHCYFFGAALIIQIMLASATAIATESAFLKIHGKPIKIFITDGSVFLTALLLALALPPLAPWWLIVVCTFFAVLIGKHIYGGLGQNPFNPAMLGFAVAIVSWPALMLLWQEGVPFSAQITAIFGSPTDALTGATPLDHFKTAQRFTEHFKAADFTTWGAMAWLNVAYLAGGLFLCVTKRIPREVPASFLGGLAAITGIFWLTDTHFYANPFFHLFSGGAMLGAFFIATDPVTGCATKKGRFLFGAGAGVLCAFIRLFGAYPDGIAFSILLMNLCAPLIERATTPQPFGFKD